MTKPTPPNQPAPNTPDRYRFIDPSELGFMRDCWLTKGGVSDPGESRDGCCTLEMQADGSALFECVDERCEFIRFRTFRVGGRHLSRAELANHPLKQV